MRHADMRATNRATAARLVPLAGPPSRGNAVGGPQTTVSVYVIGRSQVLFHYPPDVIGPA